MVEQLVIRSADHGIVAFSQVDFTEDLKQIAFGYQLVGAAESGHPHRELRRRR